jgi:RHH-type proline utilization regulon transcriptional repressor/proline dehydrogenase/delta 1-pyrroline-5-carboxylate dehydrogenase
VPSGVAEGLEGELVGPVGERNSYALRPKGTILCVARDADRLQEQVDLVQATGNRATFEVDDLHASAALFAGSADELLALGRRLASATGRSCLCTPCPIGPNACSMRSRSARTRRPPAAMPA